MQTVQDLLRGKGRDVYVIGPDATIYEALERMAEVDVGALVVVESDRLVGIVSERDYARKVELKGRSSRETHVRDIMVSHVYTVNPRQDVNDCMTLMTEKRIRHLPVVEGGRLIGLISIGDVVKAIISEQEFVIAQLEGYITGQR